MVHKITLNPNQNLFFTSDTHHSHTNICRGVSKWDLSRPGKTRDFNTLEEMNRAIIDGINSVVGQDDFLVHLGDWSFGGIQNIWNLRKQLVCENILLVFGNHDHHIQRNRILPDCEVPAQDLFLGVFDILDLRVAQPDGTGRHTKRRYFCSHYPMVSWHDMGDGVPHLHGHVHLPPDMKLNRGKALDVGVDGNNFVPYSWKEIDRIMRNQPVATSEILHDHHV